MAFSVFKLLIIVMTLFFAFEAITYGQMKRGASAYTQSSHDEDCPEKFPESKEGKEGKEISNDNYIAFLQPGFLLSCAGAEVSNCYDTPSIPFPNNSYGEITTPPPRVYSDLTGFLIRT